MMGRGGLPRRSWSSSSIWLIGVMLRTRQMDYLGQVIRADRHGQRLRLLVAEIAGGQNRQDSLSGRSESHHIGKPGVGDLRLRRS